jgi:hypothetical protein
MHQIKIWKREWFRYSPEYNTEIIYEYILVGLWQAVTTHPTVIAADNNNNNEDYPGLQIERFCNNKIYMVFQQAKRFIALLP